APDRRVAVGMPSDLTASTSSAESFSPSTGSAARSSDVSWMYSSRGQTDQHRQCDGGQGRLGDKPDYGVGIVSEVGITDDVSLCINRLRLRMCGTSRNERV